MSQEFCGGIIPICPVCDRGVNNTCDEQAVKVTEVWYHRPCSRTRLLVDSLSADFKRLDSKYGKDWTEWQDVRDDIAALLQL